MRELSDGQAKQYSMGKRAYVIVRAGTSTSHNGSWRRYGTVLRKHTRVVRPDRQYLGRPAGKRYTPTPNQELTYAGMDCGATCNPINSGSNLWRSARAGVNLRGSSALCCLNGSNQASTPFARPSRPRKIHDYFLQALDEGFVPAARTPEAAVESDTLD